MVQVGNNWDPYIKDNAFTLNYTGIDLRSDNYGYMSAIFNTYEGCLISLLWNKVYGAGGKLQVDRTTYVIRRHLNLVKAQTTEFYALSKFVYNYSTTNTATMETAFNPPCNTYKYYWHPGKSIYFYLDYTYNSYASYYLQITFTCFPYSTAPTKACDANFNTAGTPTFRTVTLFQYTYCSPTCSVYDTWTPIFAFSKGYMYIPVRYVFYDGYPYYTNRYEWFIYKYDITGSSCADYNPSNSATIYDSNYYVSSSISINQIFTVP